MRQLPRELATELPSSVCLFRRGYVPVRWPYLSSSSCDLCVRRRSKFRFLLWPCLLLLSSGCWPLFSLLRWTSSPRRHRWLGCPISGSAFAGFSLSMLTLSFLSPQLYDEILTMPLQDLIWTCIRSLQRTVRSVSSHENVLCLL